MIQLFQVVGFSKPEAVQRRIDAAQESCQNSAGSNFYKAPNALTGKDLNRVRPSDRIRHLLVETLARFGAHADFRRAPVIHQRVREVTESSTVQIGTKAT